MVLPLTVGSTSQAPLAPLLTAIIPVAPSFTFTRSSKASTILPLAEAPVAPSAGTVETSTGALPSSTNFGVPVMKNIASVLPSLADAAPSTCEVLSAFMRMMSSFWLLAAAGNFSLNVATAFAPVMVTLPNFVQFSPSSEYSAS